MQASSSIRIVKFEAKYQQAVEQLVLPIQQLEFAGC